MRLWLDDIRQPPDGTWTWVKTPPEFFEFFRNEHILEISFDHDLGYVDHFGNEITGYHCLCAIEKKASYDIYYRIPVMHVHSANPVGRHRMQVVIDKLERWRELDG